MEITLEKIELVKDRTGASYKEAKEALEACDGSVVDAIISIEETINSDFEGITSENFKDSTAYKKMQELVDKGNMSRIVIKKDDELIMNFPLTAGVVGAILVPWGVIFGMIATIGFKCKVEFVTSDGETVDINGRVVGSYNKAKDAGKKYADMGQDVIDKIKDTEAYETIKTKGKEAYDDVSEKVKTELDKINDGKIRDNIDEFKKQAEDLFKKKSAEPEDEAVSDVDADCDIDAVIDELEKELSSDN